MEEFPRISEAEWEVMRVIWDRHPLTAQEVTAALTHKDWSARTVKTLIGRLVKKGALGFEVDGKRYLYSPLVSREEGVRFESQSFVQRVLGGSLSPFLAYFMEDAELSPDEVRELKRLLEEREEEA